MPDDDGVSLAEAFGIKKSEGDVAAAMLSAGIVFGIAIEKASRVARSPEEMEPLTEKFLREKIGHSLPGIKGGLTQIQCDTLIAMFSVQGIRFLNAIWVLALYESTPADKLSAGFFILILPSKTALVIKFSCWYCTSQYT